MTWRAVLRGPVLCLCLLTLVAAIADPAGSVEVSVSAEEAMMGVVCRPWPAATPGQPVNVQVTVAGQTETSQRIELSATDFEGNPVAWGRSWELPAAQRQQVFDVPFAAGFGYFELRATVGDSQAATLELCVVPPRHPGVRKESFFASNTSRVADGEKLAFLRRIGMRVLRTHFHPRVISTDPQWGRGPATAGPLNFDFTALDDAVARLEAQELWFLPIAGYAFEARDGERLAAKSEWAHRTGLHGPPRDNDEFVDGWEQILRRYPQINTVEFWNEPWIWSWTWAADAQAYRDLQVAFGRMVRRVRPDLRLIAGHSAMFVSDHIAPFPNCHRGYLDGTSHHPYVQIETLSSYRGASQVRTLDYGYQENERLGLDHYYLTEGGTMYRPRKGASTNNVFNARKLVQYHVMAALSGVYQANVQFQIGYGPDYGRGNAAYAVMTHLLEDRPIVADVFPELERVYAAIFAAPGNVDEGTRRLPRAAEIGQRWNVAVPPERVDDRTKVVVLWGFTGEGAADTVSQMVIAAPGDLRCFDIMGRPAGAMRGDALVVPLVDEPVYLVGEELDVPSLRRKLRASRLEQITPVNVYAFSLTQPATAAQTMGVRLQNQLNEPVTGQVHARATGVGDLPAASFRARPGQVVEVPVDWPGAPDAAALLALDLRVVARTDDGRRLPETRRSQVLQSARFARRSIEVDGDLDDWAGQTPVILDNAVLGQTHDLNQYVRNPMLDRPGKGDQGPRVVTRLYTARDDEWVYVAAEVSEPEHVCSAGTAATKRNRKTGEVVELPYRSGVPGGLNHIANCGDVLQLAFGFRERVPGLGRQMGDPWAWKGMFYDTDHVFFAHSSTDGPRLVRQWGPEADRRNGYQTDNVAYIGPVSGGLIEIRRDEAAAVTTYEMAIPRDELDGLDRLDGLDGAADRIRFSFLLRDNQAGRLQWSQAAGVFDHWQNYGSFAPTWAVFYPCQTYFGLD